MAVSTVVFASTMELANQVDIEGWWNGRSGYGACWGYTDPGSGREYGLICVRNEGVSIIDLDTFPLVEVGFIPGSTPGSDAKEVRVWDHYAVVVQEYGPTLIVDIEVPSSPVILSTISGGRHCLVVDGPYVYLSGGSGPGLFIYSIANPNSPQFMGAYNPYYYHDYCIRNDTLAAFAIYGEGIDIIDVTDKTDPTPIGHFNYAGSGAHNGAFSQDGNYLFIGDEIGDAGNWTRVFDISDLENVSLADQIIVNPAAIAHNCYLRDSFLVIAHYAEGVRIWNVANPSNCFEAAYFDTYQPGGTGFYDGAWHVYPYFPSGRIIASDISFGLYVLSSPLLPPPDPSCCQGRRGNTNGLGDDDPDILDLVYLVNRIFRFGPEVPCLEEGDVNGDGNTGNILDLNFLVNLFFRSGPIPGLCP
jgi:choice-of-anchor B domain-containing protein